MSVTNILSRITEAAVVASSFLAWGILCGWPAIGATFAMACLVSIPFAFRYGPKLASGMRTVTISLMVASMALLSISNTPSETGVMVSWVLMFPITLGPHAIVSMFGSWPPPVPSDGPGLSARSVSSVLGEGLEHRRLDRPFTIDWPFLACLSCSTSLAIRPEPFHAHVAAALLLAMFVVRAIPLARKPGGYPVLPILVALPIAISSAMAFGSLIPDAARHVERKLSELKWGRDSQDNSTFINTSIGKDGRLSLGDRIVVRVSWASQESGPPPEGPVSKYIPLSYFNLTIDGRSWMNSRVSENVTLNQRDGLFEIDTSVPKGERSLATLSFNLLGSRNSIPMPPAPAVVASLPIPSLTRTFLGGFFSSARGFAQYTVEHGRHLRLPPPIEDDLEIPRNMSPILDETVTRYSVDLSEGKAVESIERFFSSFEYTLDLSDNATGAPRTMASFMLSDHRGHCEYFAGATVMMLRKAGIPARLATGYSISEYDADEGKWWGRERDAHAWAVYWDKESGVWRDIDTTPPDWSASLDKKTPVTDFLSRLSYILDTMDTESIVSAISSLPWGWMASIPAIGLIAWLAMLSRRASGMNAGTLSSALSRLEESMVSSGVPPRPPSKPFHEWLAESEGMARFPHPPGTLAIRIENAVYGDRPDESLPEDVRAYAAGIGRSKG